MDKTIKVLLIGPVPPPWGGIAKYVQDLYESDMDVDFRLFNTALPHWIAPYSIEWERNYRSILTNGLSIGLKKVGYIIISYLVLFFRLLFYRPHIVHVFTCTYWGYWRSYLYILLAKCLRIHTIFHILGAIDLFYEEVGEKQRRLIRSSFNTADVYFVQSPYLKEWVLQFTLKPVEYFWNGIHLDQIPKKDLTSLEKLRHMSGPIGISIGNLSRNKGTHLIFDALRKLKAQDLNIGWIFVGRGDIQSFQNLAQDYGLKEILFTGPVEEEQKWQYLYMADFFCLPSYAEGQPISILEAMAVGLPIIATTVGSIPEVIANGHDGLLIAPGDEQQLVDAIANLAKNENLRIAMGKNVKEKVQVRHDIYILFEHIKYAYIRLLNKN